MNKENMELLNIYLNSSVGAIELMKSSSVKIIRNQSIADENFKIADNYTKLLTIENKRLKKRLSKYILTSIDETIVLSDEIKASLERDIEIVNALYRKSSKLSNDFNDLYSSMIRKSNETDTFNYNLLYDELISSSPEYIKLISHCKQELDNSSLLNDIKSITEQLNSLSKAINKLISSDAKKGLEDENVIELKTTLEKISSLYNDTILYQAERLFTDYNSIDIVISLTSQLIDMQPTLITNLKDDE